MNVYALRLATQLDAGPLSPARRVRERLSDKLWNRECRRAQAKVLAVTALEIMVGIHFSFSRVRGWSWARPWRCLGKHCMAGFLAMEDAIVQMNT